MADNLLFVILPLLAALANLLTIMRFTYDRLRKELVVSIRLSWLNIILAIASLAVVGMVILYGIVENAHHNAIAPLER